MEKPTKDFDQSLNRIEEIAARLEAGDLSLEEAVELYQEGVALCAACKGTLEKAVQQVGLLHRELDGLLQETSWNKGES